MNAGNNTKPKGGGNKVDTRRVLEAQSLAEAYLRGGAQAAMARLTELVRAALEARAGG